MHILQPKHSKLNSKDSDELLKKINVSKSQLPKILLSDPALPENSQVGDLIKIERKDTSSSMGKSPSKEDDKINVYYRVVV